MLELCRAAALTRRSQVKYSAEPSKVFGEANFEIADIKIVFKIRVARVSDTDFFIALPRSPKPHPAHASFSLPPTDDTDYSDKLCASARGLLTADYAVFTDFFEHCSSAAHICM